LASINTDTAIWHDRVVENVIRDAIEILELDFSQVGIGKIIAREQGSFNISSHQIGVSQVAAADFSTPQFSLSQISISQVNPEHIAIEEAVRT
jgi:hypothetical protein